MGGQCALVRPHELAPSQEQRELPMSRIPASLLEPSPEATGPPEISLCK
jgi:hypothetical protein